MHPPRSNASSSDALFSLRNDALSILINSEAYYGSYSEKNK